MHTVEANFDIDAFSMRNVFFKDFFQTLHNNQTIKHYRFNFPIVSYATVFWVGIKKVLYRYLLSNRNDFELFKNLYDTYGDFNFSLNDNDELLVHLTDAILSKLNKERLIMVFIVDAPIYTLPLVAVNPIANKDFELFAFLDTESEEPNLFQFPPTDRILWRLFVWDKLKDNRYTGKSVEYESLLKN